MNSKVRNRWFYHNDTARVFRKPPKIQGDHFGLRVTSAWITSQAAPVDSPSTHLPSPPRSRWVLVKAASELYFTPYCQAQCAPQVANQKIYTIFGEHKSHTHANRNSCAKHCSLGLYFTCLKCSTASSSRRSLYNRSPRVSALGDTPCDGEHRNYPGTTSRQATGGGQST